MTYHFTVNPDVRYCATLHHYYAMLLYYIAICSEQLAN